jgi:hypothetical protein
MLGMAAVAVAVGLWAGAGKAAAAAPKVHQLARRNSDLAYGREGAEIRRVAAMAGHSDKEILSSQARVKRRQSTWTQSWP